MTSKVLFTKYPYCICVTRAGLSVQHANGYGVLLKPDHPQYADYLAAFENPFDDDDVMDLSKALLVNQLQGSG